jgi:hypothetical protein
MKYYGFVHVYQVNNWKEIISNQIALMEASGLLELIDRVYIGFVLPSSATYLEDTKIEGICSLSNKIEVLYQIPYPELYEFLTLSFLQKMSNRMHANAKIFYIHTKGVTKNKQCMKDWRSMLEYFVIERWMNCLNGLESNDVAGINWHLGEGYMGATKKKCGGVEVTPHFSGNFWWANTSYIKKLPSIYPGIGNKYMCEFWIGKAKPRVCELWHSGIQHHRLEYSKSRYRM